MVLYNTVVEPGGTPSTAAFSTIDVCMLKKRSGPDRILSRRRSSSPMLHEAESPEPDHEPPQHGCPVPRHGERRPAAGEEGALRSLGGNFVWQWKTTPDLKSKPELPPASGALQRVGGADLPPGGPLTRRSSTTTTPSTCSPYSVIAGMNNFSSGSSSRFPSRADRTSTSRASSPEAVRSPSSLPPNAAASVPKSSSHVPCFSPFEEILPPSLRADAST